MAMRKPNIWMPFYFGDYVRDTTHLTLIEHGAYLFLLIACWQNGGVLPSDPDRLRIIAKMDQRSWKRHSEVLIAFFHFKDGVYRHKRVEAELLKARANIEQKSNAGIASANSRAVAKSARTASEGQRDFNGSSTAVAAKVSTELGRERNPSPSPSPSSFSNTSYRALADAPPAQLVDARKMYWRDGLTVLRSLTGKAEAPSRAFLGRMLKELHNDCDAGMAVLYEAQDLRPGNLEAWLMAACKTRSTRTETGVSSRKKSMLRAAGLWPTDDRTLQIDPEPQELLQ